MTQTREQIETELAELLAANEAARGWGAAVGARLERIRGLERQLRWLDAPAASASPANAEARAIVASVLLPGPIGEHAGAATLVAGEILETLERCGFVVELRPGSRTDPRTLVDDLNKALRDGHKLAVG